MSSEPYYHGYDYDNSFEFNEREVRHKVVEPAASIQRQQPMFLVAWKRGGPRQAGSVSNLG
jgi:hypothetical protein